MQLDNNIEKYIERHTTEEIDVLKSLNRATHLKTFYPNMLSGSVQGKFLEMISCMIGPKYVLEIGTFTGYSAIAMAKGLNLNIISEGVETKEQLEQLREWRCKNMQGFLFSRPISDDDAIELLLNPGQYSHKKAAN